MSGNVEAVDGPDQTVQGKTTRNPIKMYMAYSTRKRILRERKLMLREETMKQDLERFLMEAEDRTVWVTYQLNYVNHQRMKRKERENQN